MVVVIQGANPPTQPLPRLVDFLIWLLGPSAPAGGVKSFAWDAAKLEEIKKKFKPYAPQSGMGCMQACYDVLGILYGQKTATDLRGEVIKNAYVKADALAKANPKLFQQKVEEAKAANPNFTDAQAKTYVRDQWSSPHNTSDHLFELMREKDLAGDKVHTPNKDAEQAIRNMTGNAPGVYFYGMAVNDHHTVTLAVERTADGSQKMYWLDQNNPGLRTEVKAGQLGNTLNGVFGGTTTTNIYAFRPGA